MQSTKARPARNILLYVTADPPPAPDGLHVEWAEAAAAITWGQVLGITEYRLYTRPAGRGSFQLLYKGRDCTYQDKRAGIQAPNPVPGNSGGLTAELIEYCVRAVNENGDGPKSRTADTNPAVLAQLEPPPRRTLPPRLRVPVRHS